MQPSTLTPHDGQPSPPSPSQSVAPHSQQSSNTPHSGRLLPRADGDNSSASQPTLTRNFKAAANAVIVGHRMERIYLEQEIGLDRDALRTFVTRLCVPQDYYLVEIAVEVLLSLGKKIKEDGMEAMKRLARNILKPYCMEMHQGVRVFSLLAFAMHFSKNRTALSSEEPSLDWSKMHEIHRGFASITDELLRDMFSDCVFPHFRFHAFCEDDFRYGTVLKKLEKEPRPFDWKSKEYDLESRRGRYYGRTPIPYVILTYTVLLGTIAAAAGLIVWWNKPRAEGIFEALQVIPLIDLFYFGIWKVFSYNDKIVRDLLTTRWTIDSVEDFRRYFNMSESEMSERLLGKDSELGKFLQPRFTSYSSVPLLGFLSFSKPCPSAVFTGRILYFVVNDAEYVVDLVNERVGFFRTITSGVGGISWIFKKGFKNAVPTLPLRRRQTQMYSFSTTATNLVLEKDLDEVCDFLG